jgi:uncharacterized repeat protein (TIGR03803 family)
VLTVLYSFTGGTDGASPQGGLFRDPTGKLYGTTWGGGASGRGTVFKLDTSNILTTLYSFRGGSDGALPQSRLVSINGDVYGTTQYGGGSGCNGTGCGTIFKINQLGRETILHRFYAYATGAYPQGLVRDSAGNLYGATLEGGGATQCLNGCGTVFKLDTAGVFTVLYTFHNGSADGKSPSGRLIRDTNGIIHGVTESSEESNCNCGVVFRLDTNSNETAVHVFFGSGGGDGPVGGLLDVGGTLYGTTFGGGDLTCSLDGCGVLYQTGKTGQYAVLHSFAGAAAGDGRNSCTNAGCPAFFGGLAVGADGSIYGATWWGGTGTGCSVGSTLGCGTIFKYTP